VVAGKEEGGGLVSWDGGVEVPGDDRVPGKGGTEAVLRSVASAGWEDLNTGKRGDDRKLTMGRRQGGGDDGSIQDGLTTERTGEDQLGAENAEGEEAGAHGAETGSVLKAEKRGAESGGPSEDEVKGGRENANIIIRSVVGHE